jgi:hypothetical protein
MRSLQAVFRHGPAKRNTCLQTDSLHGHGGRSKSETNNGVLDTELLGRRTKVLPGIVSSPHGQGRTS